MSDREKADVLCRAFAAVHSEKIQILRLSHELEQKGYRVIISMGFRKKDLQQMLVREIENERVDCHSIFDIEKAYNSL